MSGDIVQSDIVKSGILGLVQGLTEFLPVSSSGHLIATRELLGLEAGLAMDVALHVATLLAVLVYFRRDLLALLRLPDRVRILTTVALATVPGAALGYVLSDWRESIGPWWVVGGWSFSFLYLLASRGRGGNGAYIELSPVRGVLVGTAQALAIFPGVSRSGSSISAGLWLGLDREQAFRYSFLLSIPLIAGAGLKTGIDVLRDGGSIAAGGTAAAVAGMAVAFAVGLLALRLLLHVVQGDRFHLFGWYNGAAAIAFALFLLLGR